MLVVMFLKWPLVGHLETFQNSEKSCIITKHGTSNLQNMKNMHAAILAGRCDTHFAQKVLIFACFLLISRPFWIFSKIRKKGLEIPLMLIYDQNCRSLAPMVFATEALTDGHTDGRKDGRRVNLYPPSGSASPWGIKRPDLGKFGEQHTTLQR